MEIIDGYINFEVVLAGKCDVFLKNEQKILHDSTINGSIPIPKFLHLVSYDNHHYILDCDSFHKYKNTNNFTCLYFDENEKKYINLDDSQLNKINSIISLEIDGLNKNHMLNLDGQRIKTNDMNQELLTRDILNRIHEINKEKKLVIEIKKLLLNENFYGNLKIKSKHSSPYDKQFIMNNNKICSLSLLSTIIFRSSENYNYVTKKISDQGFNLEKIKNLKKIIDMLNCNHKNKDFYDSIFVKNITNKYILSLLLDHLDNYIEYLNICIEKINNNPIYLDSNLAYSGIANILQKKSDTEYHIKCDLFAFMRNKDKYYESSCIKIYIHNNSAHWSFAYKNDMDDKEVSLDYIHDCIEYHMYKNITEKKILKLHSIRNENKLRNIIINKNKIHTNKK